MFTHNRPGIDLNGSWKFCPDPMLRSRQQKWWLNRPRKNTTFPCWDVEGLWDIQVPGTWKTQFEELKWYDGLAVYYREFPNEFPKEENEEWFLCFDGIVYEAEVYLNGLLAGQHEYGYSPFHLRVTDAIRQHNQLFVLVDNTLSENRVPGIRFDWNNDGGIINSVKLIRVPRNYINNFKVETSLSENFVNIDVSVELASADNSATEMVTVDIPGLGLKKRLEVKAGREQMFEFSLERSNIILWNTEEPKLYKIELSTRHEKISDDVGFREIRTKNRRILLNGNPIRLYGVGVHSEFKGSGRTATVAGIREMVSRAKDLGVNFLRCAHYPYAEIFGREMDKAGLLWWEEVPAYWLENMGEDHQIRKACGMMRETIKRDWNRASLIFWSVSNECCYRDPDNFRKNNYKYWFTVVPMVKELDSSRLVTCAEAHNMMASKPVWNPDQADEFRPVGGNEIITNGHPCGWYHLFDVLAGNMYQDIGKSKPAYTQYVSMLKKFNKPIMLSEFGARSLQGAVDDENSYGSENRHCRIICEAYQAFAELPELTGYCPWCLVDIRTPIQWRWFNQGKGLFRYGFLDENWQPKKVYSTLKQKIKSLKLIMHEIDEKVINESDIK